MSKAPWQWLQGLWQGGRAGMPRLPLLSLADVEAIETRMHAVPAAALLRHRQTQNPQYGEDPSQRLGSGYDFADNRLYQAGDERRFINWRQYARSGALHVKQFHEELNPAFVIMLDRRRAMVFGSQQRLKAQQAAIVALALLFYARQHGFDVGLLLLEQGLEWITPRPAALVADKLVSIISAPLQDEGRAEPSLHDALRFIQERSSGGAQLYLLSDFHDLDDSDNALLWHVGQEHNLNTIHIYDPLELQLPEHAELSFQAGDMVVSLNGHDSTQRDAYARNMTQQQQAIVQSLAMVARQHQELATAEDALQTLFGVEP